MIKAFISHSSRQKVFAKKLVELLSRTHCVLISLIIVEQKLMES